MLLTITTTAEPAPDLGSLLHESPFRAHVVRTGTGPEVSMHSRTRFGSWLAVLLFVAAGCRKAPESRVDVPTTLKEVRARHSPPDTVVEVARRSTSDQGTGCHSAACLVLAPFVLVAALFPETWDEATVVEGGEVTYRGRFSTDGEFLDAQAFGGGMTRTFARLDLPRLGRAVVVETARAPGMVYGRAGAEHRTPLLPQLPHVLEDYARALARTSRTDTQAKLLVEVFGVMGEEGLPWLAERFADPAVLDASCAEALERIWRERLATPAQTDRLLAAASARPGGPGGAVSARALPHFLQGPAVDAATVAPFVEGLVRGICAANADDAARWSTPLQLLSEAGGNGVLRAQAAELAEACTRADRRVALRSGLGLPQPTEELKGVLVTSDDAVTEFIVARLDADDPQGREALLARLAARHEAGPAQALAAAATDPTAAEMPLLAEGFVEEGRFLGLGDGSKRRAAVLSLFQRAVVAGVDVRAARERVDAALAEHARDGGLHVAAAVLGERDHALAAAQTLITFHPLTQHWKEASSPEQVILYGLHLLGCTDEDVRAGFERNWKQSGPLCVP